MKKASVQRIVFIILFSALAFIGMRINFSALVGATNEFGEPNQFFTLFQFFGPMAGGFLGAGYGVLAVGAAQIVDFIMAGKSVDFISVARLLPMLFAAYYFSRKKREEVGIIIPLIAIAAFIVHPVGRQVWYYSMYWLIPVAIQMLPEKYSKRIFLRSLGSTFVAHAVGGAVWVWAFPMAAARWIELIPVVAYERLMFTLGITGAYLVMQVVLKFVMRALHVPVQHGVLQLDESKHASR